jgi:hypothetical protein
MAERARRNNEPFDEWQVSLEGLQLLNYGKI